MSFQENDLDREENSQIIEDQEFSLNDEIDYNFINLN